jgi:hypothetical protein
MSLWSPVKIFSPVAVVAAALMFATTPGAQGTTVNLSGIVLDTAGLPVSGVAIALEKNGQTATSGADGSFVIGSATSLSGGSVAASAVAGLRDGFLYLSLSQTEFLQVTAHGLDGRTEATLNRVLGAGPHRLAVPTAGSGVQFYRIRMGAYEEVLRAVNVSGAARGTIAYRASAADAVSPQLAKRSAGVALYDQITATKTGYLKSYVAIRSSDSTGLQIRMLPTAYPKFSFFVTSLKAMQDFSGSQNGFGGDFRFGETGAGAGLRGADKLCATIAERSLTHSSYKGWRAFLSVKQDAYGVQANAIDRVGPGPWYDRIGRMLSPTKADLISSTGRPAGGDAVIRVDLPNEDGVLNQRPDPNLPAVDNHHMLTGSTTTGTLYNPTGNGNCSDWTTNEPVVGIRPRTGWSWPSGNRTHWISGSDEGGCGAGINLVQNGGANPNNPVVGSGGGYGGYYCFALNP